jgi:hypothetical protein
MKQWLWLCDSNSSDVEMVSGQARIGGWAGGGINVLRLMIGFSMVAMPILYDVGGNVLALFVMPVSVYWCYGTQLTVNAAKGAGLLGTGSAVCSSTTTTRWRSTQRRF